METTYFDTPDGALAARKITLRRRMENGVSVCTVKTPLDTHGRGEWETQCPEIDMAIGELCKLGAPEALLHLTAGGLVNTCGAAFTRHALTLTVPGAVIEVAVDRGRLFAGHREAPICEVEVELKEGSEEAITAFAESLAAELSLVAEPKSKVARARQLAE
jgi:inorganic triphosphatase YgiF